MIQGKSVLAIIPARGGSKGIPRKNIREVGGKPLLSWTIEEAKKSVYIDRLIVSTDDEEIADVARQYDGEVPFLRPKELAKDDAPGVAPVLHALEVLPKYDYVVLLQPTSPLRQVIDIDGCIEKCLKEQANSCVSITVAEKTPYWMYHLSDNDVLEPVIKIEERFLRRQDTPPVFSLNGAVYIADTNWLKKTQSFLEPETVGYVMPKERSIDIDNEMDIVIFEAVLRQMKNRLER
ncbi:acylneuraminate cytidylyltransferase family protein [Brevibacillus formosus]|uniref:acylneuraminate cytidylyltransferase family protein n=1 Tax=Brevibacillus TaxID=55080 RepID=UPI000D0EE286|nr:MULTISPECIES: acylneuraminate cytidylyltransferase family protein [Brevibacillus]MBG9940490.1 acylneuraminate cytidylyltransferase [Brevibacillus formosus]MED1944685.1 acylneuraminate cytidylyltransferase family protein [Brevibacillus formosus]MED1996628.1 acylneuraminate cytidylyltransferase family protein [Brevibacillus formosus]MED2081597.1 acylneuraminate cytidylyltransferase family protein [Brevibacillus formosus]PSK12383.1 acylneuraminate cytidylyltransferase [Brevibacillus sp. NRRL N